MISVLGLVGLTFIVTRSKIFSKIRSKFPTFLSCPTCVAFWVGLSYSIYEARDIIDSITFACCVSLLSSITIWGIDIFFKDN